MKYFTQILTNNDCYKSGRTIKPKGIMVHSTGADNPSLSRYVPGNDEIGRNTGGNHWDMPSVGACVHAFIGELADGSVGVVQTLPFTMRGWHCGKGSKGSANDTHISFEICEDGLQDASYFAAVYQAAVELTADLCRSYGLDPEADGVVICHSEGHSRGIASNHGDVMHWFPRFGKSMDTFRADVARELEGDDSMLTYEQWKAYMDQYRKELAAEDASMPAIVADAKKLGVTSDGSRPKDILSREEGMAMARAAVYAAERMLTGKV